MSEHHGWKIVKEHIENNIKPIEKTLLDNEDIGEFERKSLQNARKAYYNILNFVDRRVEEVLNKKTGG